MKTTSPQSVGGISGHARPHYALPNLPPPDLVRPLTPQQAKATNAERPVVEHYQDPAAPFRLTGDTESRLRAIECLSQAIYYESASEGVDGGRAVAQVILNRMHHPGYPNSVCGVVYQGSFLTSGCQFSFTCDGSLAFPPTSFIWTRSRRIAIEALAGRVFAPVGHATHYHADYVVPYWADSLDKIALVGRHIFYRFRGRTGARSAFVQRYAHNEPPPPLPLSPELVERGLDAVDANASVLATPAVPKLEADRIETLAVGQKAETPGNLPLQADLMRGQLILGEASPVARSKGKHETRCEGQQDVGAGQITPLEADQLTASSSKQGC